MPGGWEGERKTSGEGGSKRNDMHSKLELKGYGVIFFNFVLTYFLTCSRISYIHCIIKGNSWQLKFSDIKEPSLKKEEGRKKGREKKKERQSQTGEQSRFLPGSVFLKSQFFPCTYQEGAYSHRSLAYVRKWQLKFNYYKPKNFTCAGEIERNRFF